jgi:outer membrane protein OmpA-like peptidoglycan-associated protein
MKRSLIALVITATMGLSSGCIASRKFVRNEVKTTSDTLNTRIDTTDGQIKETRDHADRINERVTGVDGKVADLDSRTTQGMNSLKGDVSTVSANVDRTTGELAVLDERFSKRNNFAVAAEKSVLFKFNSAKLDSGYTADLDAIAASLMENPDSFIVLEGHTDATGDHEYNVKLGERRVDAVKRYLAVEKNVPVYKIHVISFGAARPIASNDSRDGREKNRSVSMAVLVPTMENSTAANK